MPAFSSQTAVNDLSGLPSFEMADSLSDQQQQVITRFFPQLPVRLVQDEVSEETSLEEAISIVAVVDGRGLACPLPLLKTKVALRTVNVGEALYVLATDPNSTADIAAFCHQYAAKDANSTPPSPSASLRLLLQCQSSTDYSESPAHIKRSAADTDTFFHFIITKTDSN